MNQFQKSTSSGRGRLVPANSSNFSEWSVGTSHPRCFAFFRRPLCRAGLLLLGVVLLGGCLSRPSLSRQSFLFSTPALPTGQQTAGGPVLQLRRLTIAAPFDNQSFLYRTGTYSYERDPYAGFLVPPEETLLPALRGSLRETGLFSDVVGRDTALNPDLLLEVHVGQMYGDFRERAAPAAVLRMEFTLFDAKTGPAGKVRLHKAYEQRLPLRARTAGALMAGWNDALQRILGEFGREFKNADVP